MNFSLGHSGTKVERESFSRPQKGPAERGHVKNRQKYVRHFSTFFAQGRKRQKSSKSVKTIFDTFRQFSRVTGFPAPFWGPLNRACSPEKKEDQNSHKKGEIHEFLVLALSLVWFAGATPDPWLTLFIPQPLEGMFLYLPLAKWSGISAPIEGLLQIPPHPASPLKRANITHLSGKRLIRLSGKKNRAHA